MTTTDKLTDEALVHRAVLDWIKEDAPIGIKMQMTPDLANKLSDRIAHRRASQAAPAPSDALREVQEECDCCVDGLQADGETPCPYCTRPVIPVADAAEALLEAHKSGAWLVGKGRTLEQVAMIIAALRAALSTPTEERQ